MSGNATSHRQLVPPNIAALAAVFGGGLVGSGARAAIALAWSVDLGRFPVSTLAVNVTGSLLLGWYLARRRRAVSSVAWLRFWAIGALGSFTTFSTFSVEVVRLFETSSHAIAAGYVAASMLGGLAAAVLGDRVGRVVS